MADGDVIPWLRRLYRRPYQDLIEGKATDDECIRSILESLKKDLQIKGEHPINLAQKMQDSLNTAISHTEALDAIDYDKLGSEFDRLAQLCNGPSRIKELVLRAGRSILHNLRYSHLLGIGCTAKKILNQYMIDVYISEFKQRIPLTTQNGSNADLETVQQRIGKMEPQIMEALKKWSERVDCTGSVKSIRMPRRPPQREIDLNEDLLAG